MKAMTSFSVGVVALALFLTPAAGPAGPAARSKAPPKARLDITRDSQSGKVIVSWSGKGVLKQASSPNGRFKPVHQRPGAYVVDTAADQTVYRVEGLSGDVYSVNVVGYVTLQLPQGLSLIANPLYYTNNTLAFWLPEVPDGSQVMKYIANSGYEVSTFDGTTRTWSNPDLEVPIGTGFYFRNPTSLTVTQVFVGEVLQGVLVNPLPAGISTKGSLVPIAGSINTLHAIPGEPGDEIRTYGSGLFGSGTFNISTNIVVGDTNVWEPDLILNVGEGFWIMKQNPQDWIRIFYVN